MTAASILLPSLPMIANAGSNTPIYIGYGIIAFMSLVSLFVFSVPSFKKQSYPNILWLIGMILNLFVLYSVVSLLAVYFSPAGKGSS